MIGDQKTSTVVYVIGYVGRDWREQGTHCIRRTRSVVRRAACRESLGPWVASIIRSGRQ